MIQLHNYWRSSTSYRVRIALGLAGLEWENLTVNLLTGEHQSETHLDRNPQGLVPVLDIDGISLTQSVAIIEYLNDTRSLGLMPEDPIGRAKVRAMAYAIAMEIAPVCNMRVAAYASGHADGDLSVGHWMRHFITPGLTAYEKMVGDGPYSYGDTVTLADLCLVPQVYNAERWDVDLTEMPKIRSIVERLNKIDAFAAAHPDNFET